MTHEHDFREQMKSAGIGLHVIATGAGAGIQASLWAMPGSSKYLSGCSFPYAEHETSALLGFVPEQAVSLETAVDLASAAYMKAYRFGERAPVGIGLTAAAPTDRVRRGRDRMFVCVMTDDDVLADHIDFEPTTQENPRALFGSCCDTRALFLLRRALRLGGGELGTDASALAMERLMKRPFFTELGSRCAAPERFGPSVALLPGAFNPPHDAHFGIADEIAAVHGKRVVFQVTADPPHKPSLSVQELLKRARLLQGHAVLITRGDALYIDKARRFPETPIVLGSDALERMLDEKWGPAVKPMLYEFAQLGTHFFVSPRVVHGCKLSLDDVVSRASLDPELHFLFTELNASSSASSTALRATG